MADRKRGSAVQGFSFVELMVVLALSALLTAFAVPSWSAWRMRDRIESRAQAWVAVLHNARAEAAWLGARVTLCRSDATARCLAPGEACAGAVRDWSCGWALRSARGVLLAHGATAPDLKITGASTALVFAPPAGQPLGGFRSFEFSPRADGWQAERWRRCVYLAAGGRARVGFGSCGAVS